MTKLSQHARSPHSPSPIYGISPGFNVGDLDRAYTPPIGVLGTFATPAHSGGGTYPSTLADWAGDPGYLVTQATTTLTSSAIQTYARAVKIGVNVSGTGSITLVVKSAVDSYATTVATYTALTAGSYEFFLGGYGSPIDYQASAPDGDSKEHVTPGGPDKTNYPTSDGTSYVATRYGPTVYPDTPAIEEDTTNPNPAADSNYFGGTYNPFQFLSLDGYALEFTATVTGTVGYDVEVMPIS